MKAFFHYLAVALVAASCSGKKGPTAKGQMLSDQHRPEIHFTPEQAWMNDPNGMVYHKGIYHLFYQYYPDSTVWGPMHWGHATSRDLVQWEHQPVALYPDSLGYIFSGSAVEDVNNTSGFGAGDKTPLVAIFTHHDPKGEKAGSKTFQYQSIAYSGDGGKTWTKYAGNPVLKNPGIKDFRDPKVIWHKETKRWIMTLATLDQVTFYSSPNLKEWTKESGFGREVGAHGGVWECPDLFPLYFKDEKIWVLLVSINPGGPNGGSATQYFTGNFDGKTFTPNDTITRWIDYGPDDYAGVTWSNTGTRKVFLGWMSNWQYATVVPTQKWRSAMTVPRDLHIEKVGDSYLVASTPSPEIYSLRGEPTVVKNVAATNLDLTAQSGKLTGPALLELTSNKLESFSIVLSNTKAQRVVVGYDKTGNNFFIDRTASGKTAFYEGFARKHTAPRLTTREVIDLTLVIDNASVELFADSGLSVMTQVFFPDENFSTINIQSPISNTARSLRFWKLRPAYQAKSVALK